MEKGVAEATRGRVCSPHPPAMTRPGLLWPWERQDGGCRCVTGAVWEEEGREQGVQGGFG